MAGLGSIGQRHARLLSERPDVRLSICDRVGEFREQTVAALHRPAAGVFEDFEAGLAGQDLVLLCTPNQWHAPMALAALEAGSHVFVEKPLADSADAARAVVERARALGRQLSVGYMLRYDDGLRILKQRLDAGDIGNLIGGRAMIGTYVTLLNAKTDDRERQPYALVADYTHELDFLRWFFGPAEKVFAFGASLGDLEKKPRPNMVQIGMVMEGGVPVQVHMDYIHFPQRRILELFGDRGTLVYDFMSGEIRQFRFQREHTWETIQVPPIVDRWDDLFRAEHGGLLTSVRDGAAPLVSGEDGLAALVVSEAIVRAAETQEVQWIPQ